MGQAKQRGTKEERVQQAYEKRVAEALAQREKFRERPRGATGKVATAALLVGLAAALDPTTRRR